MPMMKKMKNISPMRKRASAAALGLRVKPTGNARRQAPVQVMKRNAVTNMGRPARDTGKFRVKDYKLPQEARARVMGKRMVEEEREVKDSLGFTKFKEKYKPNMWGGMSLSYEPETVKVKVQKEYEVSPARPAVPGRINLKRISQAHTGPRVAGASKQKTFGGIKEQGKRGTFQSRKSKRRS
jgi:hypothetical protein